MTYDRIKDLLEKIPFTLLAIAYGAYTGWGYFQFMTSEESVLFSKKTEYEAIQTETNSLKTRVEKTRQFLNTLDQKRVELRRLAQELEGTKATLSETLDVPGFMKTVITEAQRVGLTVVSLKPGDQTKRALYYEQPFNLEFRGVYVQLISFLDRIANLQKIVRAENLTLQPVSDQSAKYVELAGTVRLNAYRYIGSKADEIVKQAPPQGSSGTPAPNTTGQGGGS